ncbi:MAG TPA: hypothetical protein VGV91_08605, partial [Rubrobacter sp.]|nr:hypothetical protein [Rubrobacter sp.]
FRRGALLRGSTTEIVPANTRGARGPREEHGWAVRMIRAEILENPEPKFREQPSTHSSEYGK